jgi:hypothetical protein
LRRKLASISLTATQAAEDHIEWQLFLTIVFCSISKLAKHVLSHCSRPDRPAMLAHASRRSIDREKRVMNDLLLNYAQGLAEYQVLISACLIVFVFFAIGRDISRSLGRVEDELSKIVAAMKQMRRD